MTTEEKAKRYEKAIERARKEYENHESFNGFREMLLHIFPELKEDNGENVREEIITYLSTVEDKELIPYESWIAWLEKAGEHSPTCSEVDNSNKVETKLHVDTWVVRKDGRNFSDRRKTVQIIDIKIEDDKYFLDGGTWIHSNEIRPWTIADAENGDILAVENIFFIYKRTLSSHIVSHCNLFCGKFEPFENARTCSESNPYIHPATQKQRDLFFLAMKTSGYEWDGVNKELKKREIKFHEGDWIVTSENKVLHITSIEGTSYKFNNESHYWETYYCDNECHLWTLNDAKDGDVLATSTGAPFIYNGNNGGGSCPGSYCGINTLGNFKTGTETHWTGKTVNPATKEQRNLLFEKMKEAAYEWDNEKKELKKQSEQKPIEKTESKFHDGDWIVYRDAVWKVCNIALQNYYELLKINNEVSTRLIKEVDENAHLWSINDAKDGDVLYHKSKSGIEYIVMNKGLNEHGNINSYFRYNSLDGFGVDIPAVLSTRQHDITPATKEQRDILFKKMKEAGYEWDSAKKEVIRIY